MSVLLALLFDPRHTETETVAFMASWIAKASIAMAGVFVGLESAWKAWPTDAGRLVVLRGAVAFAALTAIVALIWERVGFSPSVTLGGRVFSSIALTGVVAVITASITFLLVHDLSATGRRRSSEHIADELESAWVRQRREAVGVRDDVPRTGLALSGGGIRSASVCLGFLHGLADADALKYVDMLSTVSGGGWAGGAMTSLPRWLPKGDKITRRAVWTELVARLRARRSYLFSDRGATIGTGVFLAVRVISGAIANGLVFACALFAFCILLRMMNVAGPGCVAPLVMQAVNAADSRLGFAYPIEVNQPLAALNIVALIAVASAITTLVLIIATVVSFVRVVPERWSAPLARAAGTSSVLTGALILLDLVLKRSPFITILALALAMTAVVAKIRRKLSWESMVVSALGIYTGQAAFIRAEGMLRQLTTWWGDVLFEVINWPYDVTEKYFHGIEEQQLVALFLIFLSLLFAITVDRNRTGLHGFWTDRIAQAFLSDPHISPIGSAKDGEGLISESTPSPSRDGVFGLHEIAGVAGKSEFFRWGVPFHIVNCAVNVPGSSENRLAGLGTDHFEFTPYSIGSTATGWAPARSYGDGVTFADAIGISAAALNTQGGASIPSIARPLLAVFNLRLGYWIRNPRYVHDRIRFRQWGRLWDFHAMLETFGLNSEEDSMVLVSDGGHHDNLGLLALVRRRVPIIMCVDAAADPTYEFADLGRTLHLLREEGWENNELKVEGMQPCGLSKSWADRIARDPVVVFTLSHRDHDPISVIYAKSSLSADDPFDVRAYAQSHADFPQQTTTDQVFDATQFDAYYMIGRLLAERTTGALLKRVDPVQTQEQDESV